MKMATALIQCMIRSGNGCRRRGRLRLDDAVACAIGDIRNSQRKSCCDTELQLNVSVIKDHAWLSAAHLRLMVVAGAALRGHSTIAVYRTHPMRKPQRFTKPRRIFDEVFLAEK